MTVARVEVPTAVAEPYHLRSTPITVRVIMRHVALCDGCEYVERVR